MDKIRSPDRVGSNLLANSNTHPTFKDKMITNIGLLKIHHHLTPPNQGKTIPNIRGLALNPTFLGSVLNTP